MYVCAEHGHANALVVYQSERFRDAIPEETWRLSKDGWGTLRFTKSSGDRTRDLDVMRAQMLTAQALAGAIFIGGMEGVADEHRLVGELAPGVPRLALIAPGGAAATLKGGDVDLDLASSRYPVLARRIAEVLHL